jgi:hypothetical protein
MYRKDFSWKKWPKFVKFQKMFFEIARFLWYVRVNNQQYKKILFFFYFYIYYVAKFGWIIFPRWSPIWLHHQIILLKKYFKYGIVRSLLLVPISFFYWFFTPWLEPIQIHTPLFQCGELVNTSVVCVSVNSCIYDV